MRSFRKRRRHLPTVCSCTPSSAANRHRSKSAAPALWALLERLGREHWPRLVRGDKDWGSEGNMASCEGAGLDYLFKLRLTKGARRLAERLMARDEWEDAGQGWSGIEAALRLHGWSRTRRVVVLRRRLGACGQVLSCVRPLECGALPAAGLYGDTRIGSKSDFRA